MNNEIDKNNMSEPLPGENRLDGADDDTGEGKKPGYAANETALDGERTSVVDFCESDTFGASEGMRADVDNASNDGENNSAAEDEAVSADNARGCDGDTDKTDGKPRLPVWSRVFFVLAASALAVYIPILLSRSFADFFNRTVSAAVRCVLSYLTVWIPFSFAEACLIFLPIAAVFIIIRANKKYSGSWRGVGVFTLSMLSVLSLFFSLFVFGFGAGYRGETLDVKLGTERRDVSVGELTETADVLAQLVNDNSESVRFDCGGSSVMPYNYDEMSRKLVAAYDKLCDEYSFIQRLDSRVKPVMLSEPWTYTHISGVYTYFTGEANINTNFPDYTLPFTAAHEMAHQRGIAREDEANFVAFLACMASDDEYIRYSGALGLYEYVASALAGADTEAYYSVASRLALCARKEMAAYNEFFAKYSHNVVADVTGSINNGFLIIQGTPGTKSYGMVVDLAVAYFAAK